MRGAMRGSRGVGRGLAALLLALAAAGCGSEGHRQDEAVVDELMSLYARGAIFDLRARLSAAAGDGPRLVFLRGAAAHAFNDPAASNRHLAALGPAAAGLPDTLRVEALRLRFRNHVRLGQYGDAATAARALLVLPSADSAIRADVGNEARAVEALVGAPPQRVISRGPSELHRRADGRVPVTVGDSVRGYVLDTGAGLSTLMRSEAEALGLEVRAAGVEVGTALGSTVTADVAVAPRVRLGNVELADVVFLVVPDEVLTFGPSFRIPGIIGFPVIDALGEVEFRRGGVLRIPDRIPDRGVHNLAMRYLTPLIQVGVLEDTAVCELDTGAGHTSLHLPLYRRHQNRIDEASRPDSVEVAGVGSRRVIPARMLSDVRIGLADTTVVLSRLPVYTESVARGDAIAADCRLGLDVLAGFDGYLINLRSMSFLPVGS